MNTQELLNQVAYPVAGQNLRRKATPLYDIITLATGTTEYFPFTSAGNVFTINQVFPLAGSQIFALTNIELYLQEPVISATLYAALLLALQRSYLQIEIDSRVMLKVPLIEVLSYNTINQQGAFQFYNSSIKTDPSNFECRDGFLVSIL